MPHLLDLQPALEQLKTYRVPVSVTEAITYLESRLDSAQILTLYQHYFPQEYAQSTAAPFSHFPEIPSPQEQEFWYLFNQRLFPIELDEWELEGRLKWIPFYPRDLAWYDANIEDFDPSIQFLLCLYEPSWLQSDWQSHFNIEPPPVAEAEQIDWHRLNSLCQQAIQPLNYLSQAVSLIDHSTENIWLDSTYESGLFFDWSIDNIDFLAAQWKQAQTLWENVEALALWLQDSPDHKLATIDLWNQACR